MQPRALDLSTLVTLAGPALSSHVIERLTQQGYPGVKASHGYVVQRLLVDEPTIGALARSLRMSQQGASKQVADLAGQGYVERTPVAGDQRARTVRLTDRGREMVEATRSIRADLERQVVARVGETDAAAAARTLGALVDLLGLAERVADRTVPDPGRQGS